MLSPSIKQVHSIVKQQQNYYDRILNSNTRTINNALKLAEDKRIKQESRITKLKKMQENILNRIYSPMMLGKSSNRKNNVSLPKVYQSTPTPTQ